MTPRLADVLKAAGEPTRLRLLNLLAEGEVCVCELQLVLSLPQHTVSRHLAALRHAGLVVDERRGQRVFYSLATTPPMRALRQLLTECCSSEEALRADVAHSRRGLHRPQCCMNSEA